MSNNFWDRFIREPLRQVLIELLVSVSKKDKKPITTRAEQSLMHRDIRIPLMGVAIAAPAIAMFFLLMEWGWSFSTFASLALLTLLTLVGMVAYLHWRVPELTQDDEAMFLLGALFVIFIAVPEIFKQSGIVSLWVPMPTFALLVGLLLKPEIAMVSSVILSAIVGMIYSFSYPAFFVSLAGSWTACATTIAIRSTRDFVRSGAAIALVQLTTLIAIVLLAGERDASEILTAGSITAANGFISAVLALGLLPFLESFFQRLTPLRLQELADFNQPLLKRLMLEAPGTYHHSLMMATIAEAAARAVGGNDLLCRVGAYYHDIGKLVKPEYFIENQGSMPHNPHGNLEPALSSLIVIQHVKEGVALARAAKLPEEIVNFIPMHHGTSRIEYFYRQAQEDAEQEAQEGRDEEVEEETYRYPGPKPHTKETAILMLADSVEAAARTIEEPSHPRFEDLVRKLIGKRIADGQLAQSPLTLEDLHKIEEAFAKTLTSIYHGRIEYPEDPADKSE